MCNLNINKNSKVYVLCPANIATGGPELLHQLVYNLRNNLKIEAFMVYMDSRNDNPVHKEYEFYNNVYTDKIDDITDNIIITPEVNEYIKFVKSFDKIQKVLWWLSVDNYYNSFKGLKKKINKFCIKRNFSNHNFFDKTLKNFNSHFVQSFYAEEHLRNKGISNIIYLSDFLNHNFLQNEVDFLKKKNIVAYNPKKGFEFTKLLIKFSNKNLDFVPIENMTRQEVIDLLKKSKVYIDFGFHPGKDRIPREAAILKCCVITGKRGSANNNQDILIPDEYKFSDEKKNINDILVKIEECINEYEIKILDFVSYIEKIKREEDLFKKNVREIFQIE